MSEWVTAHASGFVRIQFLDDEEAVVFETVMDIEEARSLAAAAIVDLAQRAAERLN